MKQHLFAFAVVASIAAAVGTGCSDADAAIDCQGICNRYQSCFDKGYNTDACADTCRSKSKNDTDFRRKADTCSACITDRDCTAATFKCVTECAGIVP